MTIVFQTRLKELREASGYKSQQSFADAFGVAQSTVGGWESGKREPNYETTMRLADYFGVTIDYLLGREDVKKMPAPGDGDGQADEIDQQIMAYVQRMAPKQKQAILVSFQTLFEQD